MEIINQIHSVLRWTILIVLLFTICKAFIGMQRKSVFANSDTQSGLFLMIVADIQLLLGLIQYFFGAWGIKNIQNLGMKEVMKNDYSRFFAVEHISMMIIAIVLIHIGRAKSKRAATDLSKHKISFWFYLIALLIILVSIPWPFKKGFEALGWI